MLIKHKPQLESYLIDNQDYIIDNYRWGSRMIMGSSYVYYEWRCDFRTSWSIFMKKSDWFEPKVCVEEKWEVRLR